ncbi:MAG: PIN domain-containing protein [Candidatus Daviesbacteria bacterium]|nr:PIN domain-containing protein [Candidatus Daviesbacteria bacterium]
MNNQVFVDTSFFKAFIDKKDEFHSQALQTFENLKSSNSLLITSNYILDETFTVIRSKCGLELAKDFKKVLEEFEGGLKIIRVLTIDDKEAWKYFFNDWSGLSFTDCVSFATMTRLGLKHVATFDTHFQRAGFQIKK